MRNIESLHTDHNQHEFEPVGPLAEQAVLRYFNEVFPNTTARQASPEEDHAMGFRHGGKAVDVVVYHREMPALAIQITANNSEKARQKKIAEMIQKPFLRLAEMKPQERAIPRTLVWLDHDEVNAFSEDLDFGQHITMALQILNGLELSLRFDLTQTSNPEERNRINELIAEVRVEKYKLENE